MDGFVHLHVHSHYSLLDGANRITDLIATAKSHGMKALALTDHGNLFGAIDFYTTAKAGGVKPILGIEAYISPTTRSDRTMGNIQTAAYHLILLAMNDTGWRNLLKLSSLAYLEGFYYRPRIDRELLSEFGEGLICTTACLGGEVSSALLAGRQKQARKIAGQYLDIFGPERFFIEVQNQHLPDQDKANPLLMDLAGQLGVGIVGTNDVHFLERGDKPAHEVLTCISTGKMLAEGGALAYSPEVFLKSPEQMRQALQALPGAADNTLKIAERCNLKLDFSAKHLPVFQPPDGSSPEQYLRRIAFEGLKRRCTADVSDEYVKRLERELQVIESKGYCSYFLIVHDFVQYAQRNNIPIGARGSGCATLLGYCLGIVQLDPIRYGLLFERWTDPQRDEDPDFDIDMCQEGRASVIRYVREKYGHVAQIITYGTLKARAVVRDVGRVMGIPLTEVDAIAKKVPEGLGVTLQSALETEPELKRMYNSDPRVQELIDHGRKLEGLARHAGVHAAGVIVADKPLDNVVPLCKQADGDDVITQWDGPTCEKVGLMKMDFLGLRTLTTIQRARDLVRQKTGKDIDPETLPLDDPKVFKLFRRGQTDGVFQFESDGMKNVLLQMQPTRIEDLIAANAMYRPGPMELIPTYCARKNATEPAPSLHPLVDDILAETYGIMVYQEQVMQVLNRLGKLPLNRALTLIKAISKKKQKTIAAERSSFIDGAKENGITEEEARRLTELIMKFAGYGFNKAHSTRYAIVAYQTAYFKVHYPQEFLAATLTFECGDTDKVVKYMADAERMGIKTAPPDINTCGCDFAVDGQQVRFGLAAVKGVGAKAVDAITQARRQAGRFSDLYNFCEIADLRVVNRATIEALIKCGAFDSLGAHRAAMIAGLDNAISLGQQAAADRRSGQMSFFGGAANEPQQPASRFPDVEPWSEAHLLAAEKETLGFYITSHPLVRYGRELTSLSQPDGINFSQLEHYGDGTPAVLGCMIASTRTTFTRRDNRKMLMLSIEDLAGKCEAVAFPDTYEQFGQLLQPEQIVFLRGVIDRRRERPGFRIDEAIAIEAALARLTGAIHLRLPPGFKEKLLRQIGEVLKRHSGQCPVFFELRPACRNDACAIIQAAQGCYVNPTHALVTELIEILGEEENLLLRPRRINGNGGANRNYRANGRRNFNHNRPRATASPDG
ncbi:MAG: DNA polymerase III subunit alpha [Planctomycetota bacterium]|nr:DNA polymerase III subunit alpha [Planctomycetota bacterium]